MQHYFDDIFQRSVDNKTHTPNKPRMRRSSTARSIGARSDFDDDARSVTNSVHLDDERAKEKSDANSHMMHYITDQLNRHKSGNDSPDEEDADEYETKA